MKKIAIPLFDNLEVEVTFDNDDFSWEGEELFNKEADLAFQNFLKKTPADFQKISHLIYKNYLDFVNSLGDEDIVEIKSKEDVLKYVTPYAIYISRRDRRDKDIYVQIHCDCEWEMEHGLLLVYRQGKKLTRVSEQDGHLTEANAYDKPDADDELLSKF